MSVYLCNCAGRGFFGKKSLPPMHIMIAILADECGRPQVVPTVDRTVKQFNGAVSKRIGYSIWQRSFYDHIIRDREDYDTRTKYILENPMRWREDELYSE